MRHKYLKSNQEFSDSLNSILTPVSLIYSTGRIHSCFQDLMHVFIAICLFMDI